MAKKILTADLLIADHITEVDKLGDVITEFPVKPGKDAWTDQHTFEQFSDAILEKSKVTVTPGGSSANTLVTLKKLLGGMIDVDFIGVVGKGIYSNKIKASLHKCGIRLLPENLPSGFIPETAVSYVIPYHAGKPSIVTWAGNAKEVITPAVVNQKMVEDSDIVFVQGSLWDKFPTKEIQPNGENIPLADKLVDYRWKTGKELWLALPTQAKFAQEHSEDFKSIIPTANVVLSNIDELKNIYSPDKDDKDGQKSLQALQAQFREGADKLAKWDGKNKDQVGFITAGGGGAYIVTQDSITRVKAHAVHSRENGEGGNINQLGAGDTAYAGFLAGHLKGLSHEDSAEIAMALAAAKLEQEHVSTRLGDPQRALRVKMPHMARELFGDPALDNGQGIPAVASIAR